MSKKRMSKEQAQQKAALILEVINGRMSATDAAHRLGISRKSFYKWQQRAMAAMLGALQEQPAGRPGREVDTEKEQLREQVKTMEEQIVVLQQSLSVQKALLSYEREHRDLTDNDIEKKTEKGRND